ncbi:uncharacterized protein LOC128176881 [Crassostrea angulata]|uniref:uncharacterized protein LOC128176881 n=1 Tax=Magallana angulata TaxID=2784310 RepID=UPI0022B1680D|nr:uncharacterized protein LOC128176881 [Crassostrea angulata]
MSPDPKKRHSISPISSPNSTFNSTLSLSNRFSVFEDDKDCVDEDCADEDDDVKDTPVLNPLPNNQFLNIDAAYQLIKASTPSNIEDKIPTGPKENIYILVKTTTNSKQEFPDDCGVWGRAGTTVNSTFIEKDGKLKTVVVRDSQICVERKVQNVRQYVPIVPQPADDSVVKCHRYYSKLKSSDQFKRRVTIFTKLPSSNKDKQDIAVVEYQGSWESPKLPHGNCTKASVPYRRTDPAILREAAHITKQHHQMPMTTCQQMMQNDSINAPRAKQIRDKVYRETKKTDSENFPLHNIADEVLCVINMCQNGENNVREIFLTPNKPPSVIVYSDEQLEDMKSNCIGPNGSVIGIDRTFNLGPCFVTTTTYKNVKILKRETLQNPIFLGPVFLHWDGETDSYFKFLCHLNSKLGFPSGLKVGSDEEKAIKNAINQSFHKPCHLLCTKHLKDNVRRYLKDKDGCRAKERETIVKSIFGHDGLLNSDDSFSFESKFADMDSVLAKFPNFQNHFQNRLKPLLHDHVFLPLQNGTVNELWTNNNSESLNNRIKQSTNWKPQKLPDLIHKLNEISSFQLNDLRRAIHGNGNYILDDTVKRHHVSPDVWVKMSKTEKQKRTWKLLTQKPVDPDRRNHIISTKCSFKVPPTAKIAQKPHQRRRPRAERTRR